MRLFEGWQLNSNKIILILRVFSFDFNWIYIRVCYFTADHHIIDRSYSQVVVIRLKIERKTFIVEALTRIEIEI